MIRYLRNTLRERQDICATTFFDLYSLPRDFPGWTESSEVENPARVRHFETLRKPPAGRFPELPSPSPEISPKSAGPETGGLFNPGIVV